jgi:hypothetical protein
MRAKEVPAGDGWLHEVKFDGCRVQVYKAGSRVVIYSRNGHDFTERLPPIAQQLHELPAKAAVRGAVLASNADGRPNFARLHVRWTRPGTRPHRGILGSAAHGLATLSFPADRDSLSKALISPISGCSSPAFRSSAKSPTTIVSHNRLRPCDRVFPLCML